MIEHNADPSNTWEMGINDFSDLTNEEFNLLFLSEVPEEKMTL